MRLTNKLRDEILTSAMYDLFRKRVVDIIKQGSELALDAYCEEFGKESELLLAVKLKQNWLSNRKQHIQLYNKHGDRLSLTRRQTGYYDKSYEGAHIVLNPLNINNSGFDIGKTVILPPHSGNSVCLSKKSLINRFQKLQKLSLELIRKEQNMYIELYRFLYACKTSAELLINWPEGKDYLPEPEEKKNLPIPLIDNVRSALAKEG